MTRFLEALLAEHGITWNVVEIDWSQATASLEGRDIEAPAIVSEIDFWTVLHEAGHVVLGLDTDGEDGAPIFENEIAVWRWAFGEAPVLPSGHASLLIDTLRHSYSNEGHVPPPHLRGALSQHLTEGGTPMRWKDAGADR